MISVTIEAMGTMLPDKALKPCGPRSIMSN